MQLKSPRSRKQVYRSRSKRSRCRGRSIKKCNIKYGCTLAKGKTRKYCRKMHNNKISKVRMASLIY